MKKETINIRISDIARMAGVSAGTVDRVLHNRGRVSEEKREKVEKVLQDIDYRPNPLARTLANKRQFRFVTLTPEYQAGEYWEQVNAGIRKAADALTSFNVTVEQRFFNQYDSASFRIQMENMLNDLPDGLVIASLFETETRELAGKLDEHQIPYVFIDSDIEGCNNLAYFGVDSYQSGMVAGHLMIPQTGSQMSVLSITYKGLNNEISLQSKLRQKGFADYISKNGYHGNYTSVVLDASDEAANKKLLQQMVSDLQPQGIIVFNSRVHEVVGYLTEYSGNDVRLIGYDVIEANKRALLEGKISWLIGQRSEIQGYDGVKALSNYLLFDEKGTKTQYMPIDILIRENIAYHHNYNL